MSITNRIQKTILLGGETFSQSTASTGEIVIAQNHNIPAALPAEFVQRKADNEIEIIPPPELAIDGAWFDVFWADGSRKRTISVASGSSPGAIFNLSGGAGDDFPSEPTDYMVRHSYFSAIRFNTAQVLMMLLSSTEDGEFHFSTIASNFVAAQTTFSIETNKNYVYDWQRGSGILPDHYMTSSTIYKIYLTPNKTTGINPATMKIGMLLPK